jgi:thiol-disulfide isomerase/thioredoxin
MHKKIYLVFLILAFIFSACTSQASPTHEAMMGTPTETMMGNPTDEMMGMPTQENMAENPSESGEMADTTMGAPAWYNAQFKDARTGESFMINDFIGKVILVEDLAMWCPTCKRQQMQVIELRKSLGERDDFVTIGLDIDLNENLADLKDYVESNNFDWKYSVVTSETAHEIGQLYGDQFLNPSSAPMLIIDRKGEAHPLPFGVKSADDLMKAIEPFLSEGM